MKKTMIRGFLVCLGILFCIYFYEKRELQAKDSNEYEDFTDLPLIRFHIRAESNEKIHQEEKMAVRKAVLECLREELPDNQNKEEVRHLVLKRRDQLEQIILDTLKPYGTKPSVSIYFTREFFPIRRYGQIVVPAGMYESLRIDLGKAKGKNWWCVLYPGFCLIDPEHVLVDPEDQEKLQAIFGDEAVSVKYKSIGFSRGWKRFFSNKSSGSKNKYPEGQTDRRKQGGHNDNTGCKDSIVAHIFCHNIAAYGGRRA